MSSLGLVGAVVRVRPLRVQSAPVERSQLAAMRGRNDLVRTSVLSGRPAPRLPPVHRAPAHGHGVKRTLRTPRSTRSIRHPGWADHPDGRTQVAQDGSRRSRRACHRVGGASGREGMRRKVATLGLGFGCEGVQLVAGPSSGDPVRHPDAVDNVRQPMFEEFRGERNLGFSAQRALLSSGLRLPDFVCDAANPCP